MRVPVEECDAVNFPLPGPNCVGWEDRNIQGLNFLSHLHATKSLICSGLARVFDFGIAKRTGCCYHLCSDKQRKQVDAVVLFPSICEKNLLMEADTTYYMMTNERRESKPIIYTLQNKERAEFLGRIAFYCFLGSNTCTTIIEVCCFF